MAEAQIHQEAEQYGPPIGEVIICALGALSFAGLAWAVVFGVFVGANFGLEYFQIIVPELVTTGLDIGSKVLPVLAALATGWLSYRFLIRLP